MIKHQSQIELIATDKKGISEFQIKVVMFPFLPMFQNFKKKLTRLWFFSIITCDFATSFFKPVSDEVKYQAIVDYFYCCLIIDELKNMKINNNNYLQVRKSMFLGLC